MCFVFDCINSLRDVNSKTNFCSHSYALMRIHRRFLPFLFNVGPDRGAGDHSLARDMEVAGVTFSIEGSVRDVQPAAHEFSRMKCLASGRAKFDGALQEPPN